MAKYTWEQVQKVIKDNGYNFSDADLALAQSNPDAGMSLINYKKDWQAATTDDQRALAHAGAESIRKNYGGYTGGADGSKFYLNEPSPQTFNYTQPGTTQSSAPQFSEFSNPYAEKQNAALDKILNREEFSNPYADQQKAALDKILNREAFSYDPSQDVAWQSAKKQYLREADRAQQDMMGQAAGLTGGMASTAAMTAANQAGDYYRGQLSDRMGELEQNAYNRYMDGIGLDYQQLEALNSMSAQEKQNYIDSLGLDFDTLAALNNLSQQARDEYDTDRNFAYNQWTDELGFNADKENAKIEQERYDKEQEQYEKEQALYAKEYADSLNDSIAKIYLSLYDSTLSKKYLDMALERIKQIGK